MTGTASGNILQPNSPTGAERRVKLRSSDIQTGVRNLLRPRETAETYHTSVVPNGSDRMTVSVQEA
ncbi:MAG: hypothetical protein LBJ20_05220 [Candidatus Methanoplasma sp.]|nr:hypothetical protein [Candidatus Methanoplasma sp.]